MIESYANAMTFDDRDLIEHIISNFFIVDYGYISQVNADGTVNVIHATQPKLLNGKSLGSIETPDVELLNISASNFSLFSAPAEGDKVLLLGLKTLVDKVEDVSTAQEMTTVLHYSRETLKALPFCVFNSEAKVRLEAEKGTLKIDADEKIEINGNDKQLVTWAELNQALTQFLTQLTTALTTTPIAGNGAPQPTWSGLPTSIDISSAKTKTIVTGG